MGETKAQKAERYLLEARLIVTKVDQTARVIVAHARGDSGEFYRVEFKDEKWSCDCDANAKFHRECSHLIALKRVTVKPKEEG